MATNTNAPIIVKRKKVVVEGGHHGGAWKVAYADFVTAMMAFFMLMWLLGATTEKQRKGIADYFNPTIPVVKASGGGSGAFGGDSVFSERTLAQSGSGAQAARPTQERQARGDFGVADAEALQNADSEASDRALEDVQEALNGLSGESMVSELLARHIVTRLSDEGLIIEIFGTDDEPIFDDEEKATPILKTLIKEIVPAIGVVSNKVAVSAHSRAVPVVRRTPDLWETTTDRAVRTRALLVDAGLSRRRVARLTGLGDRHPITTDPMAARNDRLEVIILRSRI